ncbi:alpha/beta fold hydrolase [Pacificibacter marinus]|uniref:alpha/beta fold hydrolase n=1 Tax=Pacificibacter marinus TaxID=658057 RepID=UPI000A6D468F|nr:alpha/beta hydrolase [Pacificibacter marinus]
MVSALSFLILAATITIVLALHRGQKAEKRNPLRGELIKGASGAVVHVETYGPSRAQPLILIHGMSGSTFDMTYSLVPELEDMFRIYVVDRPGFGHSPMLPYGEDLVSQARAIREAVFARDSRKPIILGQSYGGAVALAMALDTPDDVAALVLLSSPSHVWDAPPAFLYRVLTTPIVGKITAWLIAAYTPKKYINAQVEQVFTPQSAPDGYIDTFQPMRSLRPHTLLLNARQRVKLKAQLAKMAERYPTIGLPVESLHGTADQIVHHLIHAIPLDDEMEMNRLTELDGIGHMPHHCALEDVENAVIRAAARAALN